MGPAGSAGPSCSCSPCAAISHKSSYWRRASSALAGPAPLTRPTTNPGKRQHKPDKPHRSTCPCCRHDCPAAKALCCFLGCLLGLRRYRVSVYGNACPPGMFLLGRHVVSLDDAKAQQVGMVPGWPRLRFPLFPSRLRAVRHFSLAKDADPAAAG